MRPASWVDPAQGPRLDESKGIPLFTYLTLKHLRMMGVPYGGLHEARIHMFENGAAIAQLHLAKKQWRLAHPAEPLTSEIEASLFAQLPALRYIRTALTQSGHRIRAVRLTPGPFPYTPQTGTLESLLAHGWFENAAYQDLLARKLIVAHEPIEWPQYPVFELEALPVPPAQ